VQAGERHRHFELGTDDVDGLAHASLAISRETVKMRSPDQAAVRTPPERLEHVLAGADAPVEQHLQAVADGACDFG
jgi:hypothetical protein